MRVLKSAGAAVLSFLHSIRFRITLWFVLILAAVLAAFSIFIYVSQSRDLRLDAVQNMQEKLGRLEAFFESATWQNSNLSPGDVPGSNPQAPLQAGDLIILADTDGQVLQNWGANPANTKDLVNELASAARNNHELSVYQQTIGVINENEQRNDVDYLFVIVPVLRHNVLLGFLILGSPSPLPDQLRRLTISLFLGSAGMLVIAFAGGLWLADRAMRPVQAITRTARSISESDLSRRLNLPGRDELAQLGGTFDEMLARLQAAFERQRHFVADASHELRTPLTIMNLEIGRVLSGTRQTGEYQHALQVASAETERMTRLVNDLMTLARMDAGQNILHLEELDLSDVAVEAVERLSALAERRQVTLEIGEMPELCILGDRQYLIQMISNLIENGIKYGGSSQQVRVETRLVHDQGQDLASLLVSDTGPGIPVEHLPRVFDRFYRVDPARSREANEDDVSPAGSGLGLSIVARIAQIHGGNVRVSSKLGEGSTFEITLPLRKQLDN